MALSDVEIWMELQAGALIIDPAPDATTVNAASVDLHLDRVVQVYRPNPGGLKLDLRDANATAMLAYATDRIDITTREYVLKHGEFAIGFTRETIGLPVHLLARVEGSQLISTLRNLHPQHGADDSARVPGADRAGTDKRRPDRLTTHRGTDHLPTHPRDIGQARCQAVRRPVPVILIGAVTGAQPRAAALHRWQQPLPAQIAPLSRRAAIWSQV